MSPVTLKAMLGNYPATAALKSGQIASPLVKFDWADVKVPSSAFKRTVRALEFDFSELAVITYLIGKAHGRPLVLLPAVVVGRFQHPFLVYNSAKGKLTPGQLNGKRVGIRSYSVTTVTWLRGIMQNDYGVDLSSIQWVTFEEPHVAEFKDPPNIIRAPADKDLMGMLEAGEIDAAIVGSRVPGGSSIVPMIEDPAAAGAAWQKKYGAIQINHMVVVKQELSQRNPEVVREIWRMLVESKKAGGEAANGNGPDSLPYGIEANRRNLEVAIDFVHQQGLIPRKFTVDELFDDVTRAFR